ncbi:DUF4255 domain-containing protein [Saccharopolyspora elongata]|uniref:DUF4255 domain-containing protein n=1 Tax=Saccharopolyspora elongata TaxID=2530387 RepID=A0A4R4Z4F4_9PSEU|nr:DUF4255 domain-containing protein [Saccharopolyspora elongata]TDD52746.1 DUF4255 domain-containing protein [Saccharopolyspora elongata]
MIHEVDEGLRLLLADGGVPGSGVELAFDPPTTDWAAKRNSPTVSVFLYDIREEPDLRRAGAFEQYDDDGKTIGWQSPPHWFQLSYLVTAWTNRPQDEHRLLSDVLRCLVRHDALAPQWLTGTLAELGLTVSFEAGGTMAEGRSASDVWSALGGQLKPSINLRVTAPLAGERIPAGPPVTEGVVLHAESSGDPVNESARRLRYEGPTTAEGAGFAPARPRPEPKRRRRGTIS